MPAVSSDGKALLYRRLVLLVNGLANREMVVKTLNSTNGTKMEEGTVFIRQQVETIWNKNITIALLLVVIIAFCPWPWSSARGRNRENTQRELRAALLYTCNLLATEEERKRIAGRSASTR